MTTWGGGVDCYDHQTGKFTHYSSKNVKGMNDDTFWVGLALGQGLILCGHVD
jgi:hypothetical protein